MELCLQKFLIRALFSNLRFRTVVGGARVVSGAEKNHLNDLIEAAPFGRLDQMLSTIV